MKIAAISPNKDHLTHMGKVIDASGHTALLFEGGKSRMRSVAEEDRPDLMLVDGMCCDPHELQQVEHVTTHHPDTAVILICATHTPEFLINSMRAGVREVLPSPSADDALLAAIKRVAAKREGAASRQTGKIFAFMPCKGGSGATFIASNLGWLLAQTKNVLLIDLNLQLGDALSFVHDGKPASTIADVARDIERLDASFLEASTVRITPTYRLLAAPEDPAQAMEVKPEHIDAILNLAATQYDIVLLDMSRTLDTIAVKALDKAYRIFPVLQAGVPYLRNAGKLLATFTSLGYPANKVELILNRFDKSAEIGLDDVRRVVRNVNVHTVANSFKQVSASINHGDPLVEAARSSAVARSLADFALQLDPRPEERGLFGRLFHRASA
jgi:pilus assembly protein CpaE